MSGGNQAMGMRNLTVDLSKAHARVVALEAALAEVCLTADIHRWDSTNEWVVDLVGRGQVPLSPETSAAIDTIAASFVDLPRCTDCGTQRDVSLDPDPYAAEIHDDETPVHMCSACREERAWEI
jgi:hypothetical protein